MNPLIVSYFSFWQIDINLKYLRFHFLWFFYIMHNKLLAKLKNSLNNWMYLVTIFVLEYWAWWAGVVNLSMVDPWIFAIQKPTYTCTWEGNISCITPWVNVSTICSMRQKSLIPNSFCKYFYLTVFCGNTLLQDKIDFQDTM